MNASTNLPHSSALRRCGWVAGIATTAMLLSATAYAAVPKAGTKIGNQAFATYDNGSGQQQSTSSNVVQTEVLPVYDLLLEPGATKQVSPGGEVKWSHTLTNEGNAADSATLTLTDQAGTFDLTNAAVFLDQNQDGIPDNNNNLAGTDIPLEIGQVVNLIVIANAPNTATDGQTDQLDLVATSVQNPAVSDTDIDIAIVVAGGVLDIKKSIVDTPVGAPGTTDVTYKVEITNTGNAESTAITLTDILPAGVDYELNSASINAVNGGAVSDADDGFEPAGADDSTIQLGFSYDAGTETISVDVPTLAVGAVLELTFDVSIEAAQPAGDIDNTATVEYTGGGEIRSNQDNAVYTVEAAPAVTLIGDSQGPFTEGAVVDLVNVITNDSTSLDDFDIAVNLRIGQPDGYPVGTSFTLLVDGAPLVSNDNNNAFPDLSVQPGQSRNIVVRIQLPTDIDLTSPPAGGYRAVKTATSLTDSNVTAAADDIVTAIEETTVDLTNGPDDLNDASDGTGAGPEATPVSTVTGLPGETVELDLVVTNTNDPASGGVADNYALSAQSITANPGGAGNAWVVRFFNDAGTEITVTPDIGAGQSYPVTARVTIPANEIATVDGQTGTPVVFSVQSANSGSGDVKLDSVIVGTVRSVTLEANDSKQTFPGGVVVYQHSLTNTGNVAEPDVTLTVADTNLTDYVGSTIYLDTNNNGIFDGGDLINPTSAQIQANAVDANGVKDGSFDPGDTVPILVRVQAKSSAPSGAQNVSTLSATVNGTVNGEPNVEVDGVSTPAPATTTNEDTTVVVAGDVTLEKFQAIDAACDGTPDGAYQQSLAQAEPGQCIVYRITATNTGTVVAENLVITDATPSFTTYNGGQGVACAGAPAGEGEAQVSKGSIASTITCGNTGQIQASVGQLLPTEPAVVMSFSVKIDDQ